MSQENSPRINAQSALKSADDVLAKEEEALKARIQHVKEEEEAFEKESEEVLHAYPSRIVLNIGGVKFETETATLTKHEDSLLGRMFSGRGVKAEPIEDGSYFIDRDPTNFRYILNFLRMGKLIAPDDDIIRLELMEEAKFYEIDGLIAGLQEDEESESEEEIIVEEYIEVSEEDEVEDVGQAQEEAPQFRPLPVQMRGPLDRVYTVSGASHAARGFSENNRTLTLANRPQPAVAATIAPAIPRFPTIGGTVPQKPQPIVANSVAGVPSSLARVETAGKPRPIIAPRVAAMRPSYAVQRSSTHT